VDKPRECNKRTLSLRNSRWYSWNFSGVFLNDRKEYAASTHQDHTKVSGRVCTTDQSRRPQCLTSDFDHPTRRGMALGLAHHSICGVSHLPFCACGIAIHEANDMRRSGTMAIIRELGAQK